MKHLFINLASVTGCNFQIPPPAKSIRKDIRAGVRFTTYEYYIIKEKAAQAGLNISLYIRQIAINAK